LVGIFLLQKLVFTASVHLQALISGAVKGLLKFGTIDLHAAIFIEDAGYYAELPMKSKTRIKV